MLADWVDRLGSSEEKDGIRISGGQKYEKKQGDIVGYPLHWDRYGLYYNSGDDIQAGVYIGG